MNICMNNMTMIIIMPSDKKKYKLITILKKELLWTGKTIAHYPGIIIPITEKIIVTAYIA